MKKFLIFLVAFLSLFCIRNKCFGIEFSIGDKSYSIDDEKLITKSSYNSSNIEVDKIDLNKYSNYIVMPQDSSGELSEIRVLFFPTSVVPTISVTLSGSGTIHVGNLYFSPYSTEYYQVSLNVDSNSNITYNSLFFGTLNSGSCNYTTGFNGTGYLYEAYIAAGRDVRVAFPYVSFDLYNYKTSELIKSADSKKNNNVREDIIGDKDSRIKIFTQYNDDFSQCHVGVTVDNLNYSDELLYSVSLYINDTSNGEPLGSAQKSFPAVGIDLSNNCRLDFYLYDVDDNLVASNYVIIKQIKNFKVENFTVLLNEEDENTLTFTPELFVNMDNMYGIRGSVTNCSNPNNLRILERNSSSDIDFLDTYELTNFSLYFVHTSIFPQELTLNFEIYERSTNTVVYSCSYDFHFSSDGNTIDNMIENGNKREDFGKYEIDLDGMSYDLKNFDFSFSNAISSISDFFNTATGLFSLLFTYLNSFPAWIVFPLYTFFMLAIVVFVITAIRG